MSTFSGDHIKCIKLIDLAKKHACFFLTLYLIRLLMYQAELANNHNNAKMFFQPSTTWSPPPPPSNLSLQRSVMKNKLFHISV